MRAFAGVDLGGKPAPDETTVCNFRHLLEKRALGKKLFEQVGCHPPGQGHESEQRQRIGNSFASVPRNASGCGVFRIGERCFSL
jgi:IS5 family transposase